jgi:hypothetical protein
MARNQIPLNDVINDFMLMHKDDDYTNNVTETQVRVLAKRGVRELGFDILKRVKTITLPVDKTLMTVALPDDYVNWVKVGTVGGDGMFYVFGENSNIAAPQRYVFDEEGDPVDTDGDGVYDRENAKEIDSRYPKFPYQETFYNNGVYGSVQHGGGVYGLGGGHRPGYFRVNLEQNRLEMFSGYEFDEVTIEYIADEALSSNPSVHPFAVDALDKYIYKEVVSRSTIVPYNEKVRAEKSYLDALRTANSRMKSFTKEQAIIANRKNARMSPKF